METSQESRAAYMEHMVPKIITPDAKEYIIDKNCGFLGGGGCYISKVFPHSFTMFVVCNCYYVTHLCILSFKEKITMEYC